MKQKTKQKSSPGVLKCQNKVHCIETTFLCTFFTLDLFNAPSHDPVSISVRKGSVFVPCAFTAL